jgi:hypothetical protein
MLYNAECLGVYYNRLQRDGWEMLLLETVVHDFKRDRFARRLTQNLVLQKLAYSGSSRGSPVYHDEHEIVSTTTKKIEAHPDWDWADFDGRRLFWTAGGRLFAAAVSEEGVAEAKLLHDFNGMNFEWSQAPY